MTRTRKQCRSNPIRAGSNATEPVCAALELTTPARVAARLESDEVSQAHITDILWRDSVAAALTKAAIA